MKKIRVLVLTRYGNLGASSRLRFLQYFPALERNGFDLTLQPFFDDATLSARYRRGQYGLRTLLRCYLQRLLALRHRHQFDVLWIEKEALPWLPSWLELALLRGVPVVLDYDDAIFHNYDQHRLGLVRHLMGRRIDRLMANAHRVVCGNRYLEGRALEAGARRIEIIPTVIDLDRYENPKLPRAASEVMLPRIVWIGSPTTVRYLTNLQQPLLALAKAHPFTLRVIGGEIALEGVSVEVVKWSEDTEVASIMAGDIGIMPLPDSPFERGKCGYKLIQYMACGLPVVASPVGVNSEIVREGSNGFLAETVEQWERALQFLLLHPEERARMGQAGRHRVEDTFCLQATLDKVEATLKLATLGMA